jgi:SNF2 family DNA or RNA helicase
MQNMMMFKSEHRILLTGTPLQVVIIVVCFLLGANTNISFFHTHFRIILLNCGLYYIILSQRDSNLVKSFLKSLVIYNILIKFKVCCVTSNIGLLFLTTLLELHAVLQPHLLRRLKEDVEKSIPPKGLFLLLPLFVVVTKSIFLLYTHTEETLVNVELTTVQKQYYRAVLDRNRSFLNKGCKSGNTPNLINVMMQLRKLCNHPYLVEGVEDRDQQGIAPEDYYERLIKASGKLVLLDKVMMFVGLFVCYLRNNQQYIVVDEITWW